MKTDQLIAALVADRTPPGGSTVHRLVLALLGGGVLSLAAFLASLGVRHDFAAAVETWRFDLKLVLMLVALVLAFGLCRTLAQPVAPSHPARRLLPMAGLAAGLIAIELLVVPPTAWTTRLVGSNSLICLAAIPALSLAPLAGLLMALRSAAPASPALAGAAAGLLAAASGAALYALHCFDDSPLFVLTWYTLAALIVTAVGAAAGSRLLRW